MRDAPLSINERQFILDCLAQSHRIDGRRFFDYRDISISFGKQALLSNNALLLYCTPYYCST
jgi:exosome complex RNA-binding protein Rrp42 (RNase PH superfamily)